MGLYGEREKKKSDQPLLYVQQVRYYLFGVTNREREKMYRLQQVLGYLSSVFGAKEQLTMKGKKKRKKEKKPVPHLLQTRQALVYHKPISETLHCQKFHGIYT